ncbi:MAG: PQQ-binding-like beta-propeller repeat protein [Blastocatellia bacterium]
MKRQFALTVCIALALAALLTSGTWRTSATASVAAGTSVNCPGLAREAINQVLTALMDLNLPNGTANSLEAKLNAALASVERGNANAALGQLGAFKNQVEALVNSGKLSAADGQALLSLADLAITTITHCTPPVIAFSCRSSDAQNVLFWLNPTGAYASTRVLYRTDRFPIGPADPGATLLGNFPGTPGSVGSASHTGLTNGTKYYYAAFVDDGAGAFSLRKTTWGRPDNNPAVFWSYTIGGSYTPIAGTLGTSYAMLSSDGVLHVVTRGATGGFWPATWKPPQLPVAAPIRPPTIPAGITTINGASRIVLVPTLEGRIHAVNGDTGALLWTSPNLGAELRVPPCALFSVFGGVDVVMLGTYGATGNNKFYGINLADGTVAWAFDNGGGANGIGPIGGQCAADFSQPGRVYFASRRKAGGSQDTAWALDYTGTSATRVWSTGIGDVELGTSLRSGVVYLGNTAGEVHALNANTGTRQWPAPYLTGDGPVKGFVSADRLSQRLAFSTNTKVHLLADLGSTFSLSWNPPAMLLNPSVTILLSGTNQVIVGDTPGRVYDLDASAPTPPLAGFVAFGDPAKTKQPGAPLFDFSSGMVLYGTDEGVLYALKFPF